MLYNEDQPQTTVLIIKVNRKKAKSFFQEKKKILLKINDKNINISQYKIDPMLISNQIYYVNNLINNQSQSILQ